MSVCNTHLPSLHTATHRDILCADEEWIVSSLLLCAGRCQFTGLSLRCGWRGKKLYHRDSDVHTTLWYHRCAFPVVPTLSLHLTRGWQMFCLGITIFGSVCPCCCLIVRKSIILTGLLKRVWWINLFLLSLELPNSPPSSFLPNYAYGCAMVDGEILGHYSSMGVYP